MQKWNLFRMVPILVVLSQLAACGGGGDQTESAEPAEKAAVSGRIEGGLRVLTFDPAAKDQEFTIYRGDYVRAESADGGSFTIEIPGLDVEKTFPVAEDEKAYFKVPDAGSFPFTLAGTGGSGEIEALELRAAAYREVTAAQGAEIIENLQPLILDVRTSREFSSGHLAGARLQPIQTFQHHVSELSDHKNDPVFVYCRTGNRSTVAAKILIDKGFTNVVNLRRGIVEWTSAGLPVIR